MVVNIALVGCAGIAKSHAEGYKLLETVEVVATCDLVEKHAIDRANEIESFQETSPVVYTDFDELLAERDDIEAIDICTGHASHHVLAEQALDAGKHVLVEKPLGITVKAAKRVIDAAERNDRILGVAENARQSASDRAQAWAIEDNYLGTPRMLFRVQAEERLATWGWREDKLAAGGGWVFDGGVHDISQWRAMLGNIETVFAVTEQFENHRYEHFGGAPPYGFRHEFEWPPGPERRGPVEATVEDTSFATLQFENGTLGQWLYTCAAPAKTFGENVLYGSQGAIDFDEKALITTEERLDFSSLTDRYLDSLDSGQRNKLFPASIDHAKGNVLGEFVNAIREDREPELDGEEGLRDMAVPMAIYESSVLGMPVTIDEVLAGEIDTYQSDINDALDI